MDKSVTASVKPDISVIVVNWNRRELLAACLESLTRQSGVSSEIIVVDNGSSDGSAELVAQRFSHAVLIRNAVNRGFCAANNQGITAARGEFIALLNNDAEADPLWLAQLAATLRRNPRAGMAASKILIFSDPRRIDKAGHLIYPDGQNRGRGSGAWDDGAFDREEEVLWPDGCAAMYRKRMLDQIGGFDEDFFAYGDDAELGLRARIAGWTCMYNPKAVVRHHRGTTMGVRNARRVQLIERNRVLLALKLFPWSLLRWNLFYYAQRLIAGAIAAFRGQGETALFPGWRGKWQLLQALVRGDLEALRLAPRMLRKRAQIRKLRKLTPLETRDLILRFRISLRELSAQAAVD